MHLLLLYTIVLVILHKGYCFTQNNEENKIMYVRPDNGFNTTTCPGQPCESLDYYTGLTNYSNNTSFIFIPGLHALSKSFTFTNCRNIQLLGIKNTFSRNQTVSTEIQCNISAGFIFENVENLVIKNMKINLCILKLNNTQVYNTIFNESLQTWNKSVDHSYVASFPKHICFCNESFVRNCSKVSIKKTIYPGELVDVSLVAVGQYDNPVLATIVANVSADKSNHYTIKAQCTYITLQVNSTEDKTEDRVSVLVESDGGRLARNQSRWINIHFRKCPLGTVRISSTCYWRDNSSYYNATSQSIQKAGLNWVGYYNASEDEDNVETKSGFIWFAYCPQFYCNHSVTSMNVNETSFNQDEQCLAHRGGILCGACKSPYSLAISSTRCVDCKNYSNSDLFLMWLGIILIVLTILIFCLDVTSPLLMAH